MDLGLDGCESRGCEWKNSGACKPPAEQEEEDADFQLPPNLSDRCRVICDPRFARRRLRFGHFGHGASPGGGGGGVGFGAAGADDDELCDCGNQ